MDKQEIIEMVKLIQGYTNEIEENLTEIEKLCMEMLEMLEENYGNN